jgi:hypothetical protein
MDDPTMLSKLTDIETTIQFSQEEDRPSSQPPESTFQDFKGHLPLSTQTGPRENSTEDFVLNECRPFRSLKAAIYHQTMCMEEDQSSVCHSDEGTLLGSDEQQLPFRLRKIPVEDYTHESSFHRNMHIKHSGTPSYGSELRFIRPEGPKSILPLDLQSPNFLQQPIYKYKAPRLPS